MLKKIFWLALLALLFPVTTVVAQCLRDRDSVIRYVKTVQYKRDITPAQKETTLLGYLKTMEGCSYKNDSAHVFLLMVLAELRSLQSDLLGAINYFQRSADIINLNRNNPAINSRKLLTCYYYQSLWYEGLGNFSGKMKAVSKCITTAIELKDSSHSGYLRCLIERAKYNYDLGDYQRCISDAVMCERLTRNFFRLPARSRDDSTLTQSMVISSLGWYMQAQLALQNFSEASNYLEEKTQQYQQGFFDQFMVYIYAYRADAQLQQGNFANALSLLQKGLLNSKKNRNYYTSKQILNSIATSIYFSHYHNDAKALATYREALTYRSTLARQRWDDKMVSLNILGNIANVYTRQGRYDSALVYFRRALDSMDVGLTETSFLQKTAETIRNYPKLHFLQNLFLDKADMYMQRGRQGDITEAIRIYKLADQLLDRMRGMQSDPESKLFWRKNSRRLYEHAIAACYQLNDPATAFYFFEKSRAVLLNDQLAQQQWMKSGDILKQAQLKKRINGLHNEISDTAIKAAKKSKLELELFQAQQELDELDQQIRTQNPLYAQMGDTTCPTLAHVQQRLLKDHAGLLEIFSGDSAVYTLFSTAGKASIRKINKKSFDSTVNLYMLLISDGDRLNRDFTGFQSVSRHLYDLVFQNQEVPDGRIIISPDGPLFPFESLIKGNGNPVNYFLATHAVSYTYSARYLLNNFMSTSNPSTGILLGVAPVNYHLSAGQPALQGSDVSLKKLSSHFGNSLQLTNDEALRRSFLQQFPSYKIIQLYTHAADSSDRNEPLIYFADSALYLSDLMPEQVPATQLIVLSACNTGTGQLYRGEGVFSFNRGFAALGIPSCISNLWAIDNLSTYQLTEYFYKHLAKGLPIDVALQQAKLEFLENAPRGQQLPYHWAPAILVGNTDPVAYSKKGGFNWMLLASIIGGIVLVTGVWYWRKKRNH